MSNSKSSGAARVTILGDGSWGTALALTLAQKGVYVSLWGVFPEYLEEMASIRENTKFLPGFDLPEKITLEPNIAKAVLNTELVVLAIPSKFMRSTLEKVKSSLPLDVPYVTVVKGLEIESHLTGSQIAKDVLGEIQIAVLSGPSHAEEVARRLPTAVSAASTDIELAKFVQSTFMASSFRVYSTTDMIGCEIGGAVKNVISIAAGISDGLGFGDNTKAALVTRGLAEMTRLGVDMGAQSATFRGLAGIGDLITTSYSTYGRNRAVGVQLGQGSTLEQIEASMQMVAEGVLTSRAMKDLADARSINMPITTEVAAMLFENKDPKRAVVDLMMRPPRSENEHFEH